MKKLLKQILSEVQGIQRALELNNMKRSDYKGYINNIADKFRTDGADQKPKEAIQERYEIHNDGDSYDEFIVHDNQINRCKFRGSYEECEYWIADQKPKVTTGTATRQGGCSAFTYEEPLSDKQEDEIMKEVRQNMTDQKPKYTIKPPTEAFSKHYIIDDRKCVVWSGSEVECRKWIADQNKITTEPGNYMNGQIQDRYQAEQSGFGSTADQKPKLPESWHRGLLPGKKVSPYAYLPPDIQEAFDAQVKLYHLRKAYWQAEDWEPDWMDGTQRKYTLCFIAEEIEHHGTGTAREFLVFPTEAQAEHFLHHHRALIEQARELL